jgi:hypothetical protein
VLLVGAVAAVLVMERWDRQQTAPTTSGAPTTTAAPTSTPAPTTSQTPPPTTPVVVDTATAVWPTAGGGIRYTDPAQAAAGFAEFVGFDEPVVGEFMQGDARSGEVEIRPMPTGPATTVFVRQLEDDHWWVLGSACGGIRLDAPEPGEAITTPVRLMGAANAFEGHVSVTIVEDDGALPIATGYVTGTMGGLGPFDSEIGFLRMPTHEFGAILLTTSSAEDGRLWEAGVVRIRFAPQV